jgi:hypothetical protein
MARKSYSSFYNWVENKIHAYWYTEKDVKHPEYSGFYYGWNERLEFVLIDDNTKIEVTNYKTGVVTVYDLPEKVVRIDINPFASGKGSSAKDLFFESEARDKINAWLIRLSKAGLDVGTREDNNPSCSE